MTTYALENTTHTQNAPHTDNTHPHRHSVLSTAVGTSNQRHTTHTAEAAMAAAMAAMATAAATVATAMAAATTAAATAGGGGRW